jgi:hypothetical protein
VLSMHHEVSFGYIIIQNKAHINKEAAFAFVSNFSSLC